VFIARAMCGIECKRRRLVFEEQSASCSNCDQQLCKKLDDHCLRRDPRSRVLNSIQFICISISLLMPNKLLYTWCRDYCKCVRLAQLPVLTEVPAPSLWEQHPWYVPHRDRPGYNSVAYLHDFLCEVLLLNLLPLNYPPHPFIGHSQHMPMFFVPDEKPNFT
jgi:hypothetical protein